jgi:peptide/nickel transport system permease protein
MQLAVFVARRLAVLVPTLFFVSVLIFSLQQLLPGDAAIALAGEEQDPAVVAAIRAKYHLDRPMVVQYGIWMGKVLRGDLGESLRNRIPVAELLAAKLPVTVELALSSMLVALVIGIPTGVLSAARRGTPIDVAANAVALSGLSVPHFWLGIMLILLFSEAFHLLPPSGLSEYGREGELGARLRHAVLPTLTLGLIQMASFMRFTRSSLLEALRQDYVRTARAKGVPGGRVVWQHALRNALIPVVTVVGLSLPTLVGGAVLTETVFAWPGIGRLAVGAVFERDYPVIMGVNLLVAAVVITANLLTDLAYCLIDPRISYS